MSLGQPGQDSDRKGTGENPAFSKSPQNLKLVTALTALIGGLSVAACVDDDKKRDTGHEPQYNVPSREELLERDKKKLLAEVGFLKTALEMCNDNRNRLAATLSKDGDSDRKPKDISVGKATEDDEKVSSGKEFDKETIEIMRSLLRTIKRYRWLKKYFFDFEYIYRNLEKFIPESKWEGLMEKYIKYGNGLIYRKKFSFNMNSKFKVSMLFEIDVDYGRAESHFRDSTGNITNMRRITITIFNRSGNIVATIIGPDKRYGFEGEDEFWKDNIIELIYCSDRKDEEDEGGKCYPELEEMMGLLEWKELEFKKFKNEERLRSEKKGAQLGKEQEVELLEKQEKK